MTADSGDVTGCTASAIALLALSASLVTRMVQAREAPEPFAMIGPALVKGNYHQYPPFYGYVIAPHAVLAEGRVFCAFQDTNGRPVVMVYDIQAKTRDSPARLP